MNEIQAAARQLPDNLEDLSKFVLVGREKLNAVRAEIRAIKAVELAAEVHEQKLAEAQDIAEAVLDAEAKLGELTSRMEKAANQYASNSGVTTKSKQLEQIGLSKMDACRYENLAAHPEIVEKAKAEARANGEIVTRQSVIHKIATECHPDKYQQAAKDLRDAKKRHKEFEEKKTDGVVDLADAKQNKEDEKIIFEDFSRDFVNMVQKIRSFGAMVNIGSFEEAVRMADKYELRQMSERLSDCYRAILKMQRIVEEVIDEE